MKSCIFNQTGPPRRVDAWPRYGSVYVMCRYQGHNNTLLSSRTKIRVDNLAFANLCSYPLSCTAATVEILGLSVFLRDTTARHAHIVGIVGIKLATLRQLFGALTGRVKPMSASRFENAKLIGYFCRCRAGFL